MSNASGPGTPRGAPPRVLPKSGPGTPRDSAGMPKLPPPPTTRAKSPSNPSLVTISRTPSIAGRTIPPSPKSRPRVDEGGPTSPPGAPPPPVRRPDGGGGLQRMASLGGGAGTSAFGTPQEAQALPPPNAPQRPADTLRSSSFVSGAAPTGLQQAPPPPPQQPALPLHAKAVADPMGSMSDSVHSPIIGGDGWTTTPHNTVQEQRQQYEQQNTALELQPQTNLEQQPQQPPIAPPPPSRPVPRVASGAVEPNAGTNILHTAKPPAKPTSAPQRPPIAPQKSPPRSRSQNVVPPPLEVAVVAPMDPVTLTLNREHDGAHFAVQDVRLDADTALKLQTLLARAMQCGVQDVTLLQNGRVLESAETLLRQNVDPSVPIVVRQGNLFVSNTETAAPYYPPDDDYRELEVYRLAHVEKLKSDARDAVRRAREAFMATAGDLATTRRDLHALTSALEKAPSASQSRSLSGGFPSVYQKEPNPALASWQRRMSPKRPMSPPRTQQPPPMMGESTRDTYDADAAREVELQREIAMLKESLAEQRRGRGAAHSPHNNIMNSSSLSGRISPPLGGNTPWSINR
eukprot:PhM_4_TR6358/c0_g1_i1/m.40065